MVMKLNLLKPKKGINLPSQIGRPDDVYAVCWIHPLTLDVAVANFTQYLGVTDEQNVSAKTSNAKSKQGELGKYKARNNKPVRKGKVAQPNKPQFYQRSELSKFFERVYEDGRVKSLSLPPFITSSDDEHLDKQFGKHWLKRRDNSYGLIDPLLPESPEELHNFVAEYLQGNLFNAISQHIENTSLKSATSITRRLNTFITLGLVKNSLLPFGWEHCGNGESEDDTNNPSRKKRGRKSKYSDFRGILQSDKDLIIRVQRDFKISERGGRLDYGEMYDHYMWLFEKANNLPHAIRKSDGTYEWQYPENKRISSGMFRHHFNELIDLDKRLILKDGEHRYSNELTPKLGEAKDGVIGAGHVVEFDHSQIDTHVRLPGVHDKRYSSGRLYLCVAICVYTRYILGFSLSYRPPCWDNIAECIINCVRNKVELAAEYGVKINGQEWPSHHIPVSYRIDNGPEYPAEQENELLSSPFHFTSTQQVRKGAGIAKSIVERQIGTHVDKLARNPGGMEKKRDKMEQDASQQALLTARDIGAQLIDEILLHNNTADREHLLDKDMLEAGVDGTPHALWEYSLEEQMSGGNPVYEEDIPNLRYTLLPKKIANITSKGISFSDAPDLFYDSDADLTHDWYMAKIHKTGKYNSEVKVAYSNGSLDNIYYQTPDGKIVPFKLKNECERFSGMSWFEYGQVKKARKAKNIEQKNQRAAGRSYNKAKQMARIQRNQKEQSSVPLNDQRGYQTEVTRHNAQMRKEQLNADAEHAHNQMTPQFSVEKPEANTPNKPADKKTRRFY